MLQKMFSSAVCKHSESEATEGGDDEGQQLDEDISTSVDKPKNYIQDIKDVGSVI